MPDIVAHMIIEGDVTKYICNQFWKDSRQLIKYNWEVNTCVFLGEVYSDIGVFRWSI